VPDRGFSLSFELDVARPPREVFALLVDPDHFRVLDPALRDYGPKGALIQGSEGWFKHRRGAMTATTTFRVTDFDAPRRLEVAISGMGYAMTEAAELEATRPGQGRASWTASGRRRCPAGCWSRFRAGSCVATCGREPSA